MAEPVDRAVASDLGDDGGRAHHHVVPVRVVARLDARRRARPVRDAATEPVRVRVAGVHVGDVGRQEPDQRPERPRLELIEPPVGDEPVDLSRSQDHRPALPDGGKLRIDLLARGRRELLRVPGPSGTERFEPVGPQQETADDERAEDAPAPSFVDP